MKFAMNQVVREPKSNWRGRVIGYALPTNVHNRPRYQVMAESAKVRWFNEGDLVDDATTPTAAQHGLGAAINAKWLRLAGQLLETASDHFGNHACNEVKWPTGWTEAEQQSLLLAMAQNNENKSDPADVPAGLYDWWVMSFLADQLATWADALEARELDRSNREDA